MRDRFPCADGTTDRARERTPGKGTHLNPRLGK